MNVSQVLASEASRKSKLVAGGSPGPAPGPAPGAASSFGCSVSSGGADSSAFSPSARAAAEH